MTAPCAGPEGSGRRPTFIVVGAMKAGTTSLFHYLRAHDEIFMPKVKELDFFVEEMNWARGVRWYEQQFAASGGHRVRGEASTVYTKFPRYRGVPERMAALVPDVRLVYLVRDPVDRIRSHYRHRVATGAETAAPEEAVFANPIYLDYSRYALQVEQYLQHFAAEQLLVITSEALLSDRRATMRRVYDFVGVAPDFLAPDLDTEFYRTDQRRSYPPFVWSARQFVKRRFPQAKRAKEVVDSFSVHRRRAGVPAWTVASGGGAVGPPGSTADALFAPEVRDRLTALLADDVAALRGHAGAGFDGWGIA